MFCAAAVCAVRLAACVWPEGEQATALNEATIWYEDWLVISVMCNLVMEVKEYSHVTSSLSVYVHKKQHTSPYVNYRPQNIPRCAVLTGEVGERSPYTLLCSYSYTRS